MILELKINILLFQIFYLHTQNIHHISKYDLFTKRILTNNKNLYVLQIYSVHFKLTKCHFSDSEISYRKKYVKFRSTSGQFE